MDTQVGRSKHDVFVGQVGTEKLEQVFNIGYAFKYDGCDYYILKLWPMPGASYYLAKNRDGDRYTVFAKMVTDFNGVKFQNPIGYGLLPPDLKDYVEICLRLPKQRVFMSLYPAK